MSMPEPFPPAYHSRTNYACPFNSPDLPPDGVADGPCTCPPRARPWPAPNEPKPKPVAVKHPPPKQVTVSICPDCGRVRFAHHVHRENTVPRRYCSHCGGWLAVGLYAFVREIPTGGRQC